MSLRQRITSAYLVIAVLYGLYGWLFGTTGGRGLFYHLGAGLVWPVSVFPALGGGIAAILIIVFVILILVFGKGDRNG